MNTKILVVDDDESIVDAIRLLLETSGYQVDTTANGKEVVPKTISYKPDIILLDVLLSGADGRTICAELKSTPSVKHIPVIMISAHPSAEKSIREAQADAFLPKPFEVDELLELLQRFAPQA